MEWDLIKTLEICGLTSPLIAEFLKLFLFKFDQSDHPYYIMKEALFDTNSISFKNALTDFRAKTQYTKQEGELMNNLNFYLSNLRLEKS